MHVPYNYLPTEFEDTEEIFDEWKELIKSTDFTLGHYVEEFESIFSDYIGSKYCVATNCGTDALILSMKAIGLGEGDEVIVPNYTFVSPINDDRPRPNPFLILDVSIKLHFQSFLLYLKIPQ